MYLEKKLSVAEIAAELGETFPKTLYWVKKHGIPIRSSSERTYVKHNPGGDPFHPKEQLTPRERELFLLGLAIYWTEGSRKVRYNVQVVNMDHRMLQLFVRFLRDIACVREERLRLSARVYHGFDKSKAQQYWSRLLKLRSEQVFAYPHIDERSDPNKQWSPYGIATVCVSSTKLKAWMDQQLEENIERLMEHWSYANFPAQQDRRNLIREALATYTYA